MLNIKYCDRGNKLWFYFYHLKVEGRDKEIERLNLALKGGRPHDVISLEAQNIGNEKLIAHLNLQVSVSNLICENIK